MKSLIVLLGVLGLLVACGVSPQQQCKDAVAASCKKLFECFTTSQERAALMLGANANECTTTGQLNCRSDDAPCAVPTDGGVQTQWDPEAAAQCIREFTAIKCPELKMGNVPTSCSNTCK